MESNSRAPAFEISGKEKNGPSESELLVAS